MPSSFMFVPFFLLSWFCKCFLPKPGLVTKNAAFCFLSPSLSESWLNRDVSLPYFINQPGTHSANQFSMDLWWLLSIFHVKFWSVDSEMILNGLPSGSTKISRKKKKNRWKALDRASNELRLLLRAALARDPSLGDFWKTRSDWGSCPIWSMIWWQKLPPN